MVDISGYIGQAGVWGVTLLKFLGVFTVLGLFGWWLYNRKSYDTTTVTLDVDAKTGNINGILFGKGGCFVDKKTNMKLFWLKGTGVGLEPDTTPYLPVLGGKDKLVLLLKKGLKSYSYIRPQISADDKFTIKIGEDDVNWAVNAYERQIKMFGTSLMDRLLPYIPLIIVGMIMVIIIVYFMKQLPQIKELLTLLLDITKTLAQAKTGQVV